MKRKEGKIKKKKKGEESKVMALKELSIIGLKLENFQSGVSKLGFSLWGSLKKPSQLMHY